MAFKTLDKLRGDDGNCCCGVGACPCCPKGNGYVHWDYTPATIIYATTDLHPACEGELYFEVTEVPWSCGIFDSHHHWRMPERIRIRCISPDGSGSGSGGGPKRWVAEYQQPSANPNYGLWFEAGLIAQQCPVCAIGQIGDAFGYFAFDIPLICTFDAEKFPYTVKVEVFITAKCSDEGSGSGSSP